MLLTQNRTCDYAHGIMFCVLISQMHFFTTEGNRHACAFDVLLAVASKLPAPGSCTVSIRGHEVLRGKESVLHRICEQCKTRMSSKYL